MHTYSTMLCAYHYRFPIENEFGKEGEGRGAVYAVLQFLQKGFNWCHSLKYYHYTKRSSQVEFDIGRANL